MSNPIRCVLGFDYGHKKIGVAVGQTVTGTATALETIMVDRKGGPWDRTSMLIKTWQPDALIVGHPLTLDGQEQPASEAAQRFARDLEDRYSRPVVLMDERLTTREARRQFKSLRGQGTAKRQDAAQIDAIAARLIVESWLLQYQSEG